MSSQSNYLNENNYKYNSTKVFKNNYPINIDVDSLCEELYHYALNKEKIDNILEKVEKDILSSDSDKKQNLSDDVNKLNSNNFMLNNEYYTNGNKYIFKTTLPEGELIKEPIYQTNVLHKKYTDVNANSKFYYPSKDYSLIGNDINFKTQWTNRANKIVMDNYSSRYKGASNTMNQGDIHFQQKDSNLHSSMPII